MMKKQSSLPVLILSFILVVSVVFLLVWRQRVPPVQASFAPTPEELGRHAELNLDLKAARGGLSWAELRLIQADQEILLDRREFSDNPAEFHWEASIDADSLGLKEGPALLEIHAKDAFWRPIPSRETLITKTQILVDLRPPIINILSATRYVSQGGSAIAVLQSPDAAEMSLKVGNWSFPAQTSQAISNGTWTVLFGIPWDHPVREMPVLEVRDRAGNMTPATLSLNIKRVSYPSGSVDLSEEMLRSLLPRLLPTEDQHLMQDDLPKAFLRVNNEMRKEASRMKIQLGMHSNPDALWSGEMIQPRNTRVISKYAASRDYRLGGQVLDHQVHMGYDLASVQQAPVPAANSGIVVHSGPLGIYGLAIILDHGQGLQSLYGHCSSLSVQTGDAVSKGQEIARTGKTGLAVGDHLHFELMVRGLSVDALQWWDGKWVESHILQTLVDGGVDASGRR